MWWYRKAVVCFGGVLIFSFSTGSIRASDFGSSGLITIPSASMLDDGQLAFTYSRNQVASTYNLTFQITPSIEGTFRYSLFNPFAVRVSDAILESRREALFLRDRSYEVKYRLFSETNRRPEVAIGIRDILGSGVWSGEYVVATKRFGLTDVTIGLGWGRFGQRKAFSNPLSLLNDEFNSRPEGIYEGLNVGELRSKAFFKGDVGVFGGFRHQFNKYPIDLIVEYTSDRYDREIGLELLKRSRPWSYGLNWKFLPGLSLQLSHQIGQFHGVTIKSVKDFKSVPKVIEPSFYSSADPLGARLAPEHIDLNNWYDKLLFDVERAGIRMHRAKLDPGNPSAEFLISNDSYALWADALDQFFKLAEIHVPQSIMQIQAQTIENNHLGPRVIRVRDNLESRSRLNARVDIHARQKITDSVKLVRPTYSTDFRLPRLALTVDLGLRVQLMDPDEPLKKQLYLNGKARLAITNGLNLWSSYSLDINNDFNVKRAADSVLPRVRSEINRYLTEGETGIDSLFIEHRTTVRRNIHMRSYVGLLEEMFGGGGIEALYHPSLSRIAVGANVNWVKQRSFNKGFSFRDYSVLTGHLSMFYASPWHQIDLGVHVGRYLAGDVGVTFEARRTFVNGFSIGAFATRTNVSDEDFGEGSFDKGLFLRVPFNLFTNFNNRASYSTVVRSLERDGGRKLEGAVGNLWWDRRAIRADSFSSRDKERVH